MEGDCPRSCAGRKILNLHYEYLQKKLLLEFRSLNFIPEETIKQLFQVYHLA